MKDDQPGSRMRRLRNAVTCEESEASAALASLFDSLFDKIPGTGMPNLSGIELRLALYHPLTPFDEKRLLKRPRELRLLRHPEELRFGLSVYRLSASRFNEYFDPVLSIDHKSEFQDSQNNESSAQNYRRVRRSAQRCLPDNLLCSTARFEGYKTFKEIAWKAVNIMAEGLGPFDIHYFYDPVFEKERVNRINDNCRKNSRDQMTPSIDRNETAIYLSSQLIERYHQLTGRLLLPANEAYRPWRLPGQR